VTAGDQWGYYAGVLTLREGKTIRVQVHTDTAVMERVYGKHQVAPGNASLAEIDLLTKRDTRRESARRFPRRRHHLTANGHHCPVRIEPVEGADGSPTANSSQTCAIP
jgi:hypothetical protein